MYQRCVTIMQLVHNRPEVPTLAEVASETGIPLSSVRKTVVDDFPEYFSFGMDNTVKLSGRKLKGVNLDTVQVQVKTDRRGQVRTPSRAPKKREGAFVWKWDRRALSYLDSLFQAKHKVDFKEVLVNAHNTDTLEELDVIGKTIVHAVQEMKKSGDVTF